MNRSRILVYDRRTGRTVWSCALRQFAGAVWSADRRSVVVMDWWAEAVKGKRGEPSSTYRWRFRVWTAGEPVRVFERLPDVDGANTVHLSWSPDRQRWLLLIVESARVGAGRQGAGGLLVRGVVEPAVEEGRRARLATHRRKS